MARNRKYAVALSETELNFAKYQKSKAANEVISKRYDVLITANKYPSLTYKEIGSKVGVSEPTVISTLKSFCSGGFEEVSTIYRNPNSDIGNLKIDGDIEAQIIAIATGPKPKGASRWTMDLITDSLSVILTENPSLGVESVSRSAVAKALLRSNLRPHLSEYWCLPPKDDADFAANMEDVLCVYKRKIDPEYPLWCMDEKPYQLLDDAREPLPMRLGDIEKIDSEYQRHGTASVFCFIKPHEGRIVHYVEETRTALDWAEKIKLLVDEIEPDAKKIVLVMDNLNTHCMGSLYKTFPPAEARRIAERLEVHYTPKHGSWLNIAEIGIHIMTRECLDRRIPGIDDLRNELNAWSERYKAEQKPINWQFNLDDARIKLKSLYPDLEKHRKEREDRRSGKIKPKKKKNDAPDSKKKNGSDDKKDSNSAK